EVHRQGQACGRSRHARPRRRARRREVRSLGPVRRPRAGRRADASSMPFLPVGGQAVVEGVMMRSPSRVAVACRRPAGSIAVTDRPFVSLSRRYAVLGWPLVRGAVALLETLALGMGALAWSAEMATAEKPAEAAGASAA